MSAAARNLGLWVRIPPGVCMSVCCVYCVLSGRGLCVGLITCPEESYRLWCVVVCDHEDLIIRRPWNTRGRSAMKKIQDLWNFTLCLPLFLFKLWKPTGHVMHQQFNIQQLYVLPTMYLCVLYLSENKQRLVSLTA